MSNASEIDVYQFEIVNERLIKKVERSEAAAANQCIIPRWLIPIIAIIFVLTIVGAAFALGYYITLPRSSNPPYRVYNQTCTIISGECDSSRGLYCLSGICTCQVTNATYNGSYCGCPNLTLYSNQACVTDPVYGQACSSTVPCYPNFICGSSSVCTCNSTNQYFNGSYCLSTVTFGQACTETLQCTPGLYLNCTGSTCSCAADYYWNGVQCVSKILGWQPCNNITSGTTALPCDQTLGLYCYSNYTCQCPNTMYWDINDQFCDTKRLYGDICNGDFYCNETLNLICPTTSGTCNCPTLSSDYTCDCQPNWFYDQLMCMPRKSINGTCPGTYACDRTTPLVCYDGLCLCPTPTVWTGSNCTCPITGQYWTGTTCVTSG